MYNAPNSDIEMNIINTSRDLWRQQIIWMRVLIVNICCNFFDTSFIIQSLCNNVQNFVNYLMKYYGYKNDRLYGERYYKAIQYKLI
jgi:hypothetical protein